MLFEIFTPLIFSIGVISIVYHYLIEESFTKQIFIYITGLIILMSFYYFLNVDLIKDMKEKLKTKNL